MPVCLLLCLSAYLTIYHTLSQGEKYLVLKKKYRQLLQEREPENHGTGKEGQGPASPASPASSPATVLWEGTILSPLSSPQKDLKSSDSELKLYPPKAPDQGSRQRPAQVMWDGGPTITVTGAPDQEPTPEVTSHHDK